MDSTNHSSYVIVISGPVSVHWTDYDGDEYKEITDDHIIKSFDGVTYMDSSNEGRTPLPLSRYLYDGEPESSVFANTVISSGVLKYAYRQEENRLWLLVQYVSNNKLNEEQLQVLGKYTSGQWLDGAGQNFTGELTDANDGVAPLAHPTEIYVLQQPMNPEFNTDITVFPKKSDKPSPIW